MKRDIAKQAHIKQLGERIKADVWQLTQSELVTLADLAKEVHYKKPLLHSRGFGYFLHLQRYNNQYHIVK